MNYVKVSPERIAAEDLEELDVVLSQLTFEQEQVLRLRFFEQQSCKQVAKILGFHHNYVPKLTAVAVNRAREVAADRAS